MSLQATVNAILSEELGVRIEQINVTVDLLKQGSTVPFIARYRKEATGGLSDVQLRNLEQRLGYLNELQARREVVLHSIQEQGKLTPSLAEQLNSVQSKQELEDLYLPYKPKRRTKGQIAREAGLEPLAQALLDDPQLEPQQQAQLYLKELLKIQTTPFSNVQAVLDGARDILAERWAEDSTLVQKLRQWLWQEGRLISTLLDGKNENDAEITKFKDYFDYAEPIARIPSHRALALFRGLGQGILQVRLVPPDELAGMKISLAEGLLAKHIGWIHQQRPADDWLRKALVWTWRVKLSLSLERDLFSRLRESSEEVAIKVFADNLRDLLLAAPAGAHKVMGLDPGIRTGVKVAVVDETGKLLKTTTIYPHEPRKDWDGALRILSQICLNYQVQLIAIGNGTASRETDKLAGELIKLVQEKSSLRVQKVVVSEAGASVYSASVFASEEMPDVDVSLRGAVSIARRLQDPLAELVKISPKSIGVGQYQHDVNQTMLARTLDAVVEDCVNAVGIDLNTASAPLLTRVSGLSARVAQAIVQWREAHGAFRNRKQLLKVNGLGDKTYEQSAGFLRIRGGDNPLDMTGVHPETYKVVEAIMSLAGQPVECVMGNAKLLSQYRPEQFVQTGFGAITVRDILSELEKPGRDPRPEFMVARFNEGVEDIVDVHPEMILQGTVSNVAQFGAFVDIGVHQDGLVHVSQLSDSFVKDARAVVKTGQIVTVKVLEVDIARKRISLSLRLDVEPQEINQRRDSRPKERKRQTNRLMSQSKIEVAPQSAMQTAFAKLQQEKISK